MPQKWVKSAPHQSGKIWNCGNHATVILADLIEDKSVECVGSEWDQFGRLIAICTYNDRNINAEMVKLGYAWAFTQYSDDYVKLENAARKKKTWYLDRIFQSTMGLSSTALGN